MLDALFIILPILGFLALYLTAGRRYALSDMDRIVRAGYKGLETKNHTPKDADHWIINEYLLTVFLWPIFLVKNRLLLGVHPAIEQHPLRIKHHTEILERQNELEQRRLLDETTTETAQLAKKIDDEILSISTENKTMLIPTNLDYQDEAYQAWMKLVHNVISVTRSSNIVFRDDDGFYVSIRISDPKMRKILVMSEAGYPKFFYNER